MGEMASRPEREYSAGSFRNRTCFFTGLVSGPGVRKMIIINEKVVKLPAKTQQKGTLITLNNQYSCSHFYNTGRDPP